MKQRRKKKGGTPETEGWGCLLQFFLYSMIIGAPLIIAKNTMSKEALDKYSSPLLLLGLLLAFVIIYVRTSNKAKSGDEGAAGIGCLLRLIVYMIVLFGPFWIGSEYFSEETFGKYNVFLLLLGVLLLIAVFLLFRKMGKAGGRGLTISISQLDNYSGEEFEEFCAQLFRQSGFADVKLTPPSGDHGVDILAKKNGFCWAIQCKRSTTTIGNKAIQEAYTGKAFYDAEVAAVITNNFFTAQAKQEASKLGVFLIDRNELVNMISKMSSSGGGK